MKRGQTRNIKGETYRVTVFLVTSRKPDGTPNECRRIADDEKVHLKGGEEFITAFVHANVLDPKTAN